MIEKYEFGRIVIDGKEYTDDVRIIDGKVLPKWWRKEGHFLYVGDLKEVFSKPVKILVVGTGHSGVMKVGESVRADIRTIPRRIAYGRYVHFLLIFFMMGFLRIRENPSSNPPKKQNQLHKPRPNARETPIQRTNIPAIE